MVDTLATFSPTPPYYCSLSFGPYVRPNINEDGEWKRTLVCHLPLPAEMSDYVSSSTSGVSFESVGDVLNGDYIGAVGSFVLRDPLAIAGGLMNAAFGEKIPKNTQDKSGIERLGTNLLGALKSNGLSSKNVASAVQQSLPGGAAPNPNHSVIYEGPTLREFSYNWFFSANSKDESKRIKDLIDNIKRVSLGSMALGKGRSGILQYPHLCQLNFYPWDSNGEQKAIDIEYGWSTESIIKIKKCFATNVATNYTPGNIPSFHEGTSAPVTVQMTISFQEVEYMLSHDYYNDYNSNGTLLGNFQQIADVFVDNPGSLYDPKMTVNGDQATQ